MGCFKGLSVVISASSLIAGAFSGCALGQERQSPGFELVGPPETAAFERALDRRLAAYAWGIWPRPEKLKGALRGAELPRQYVSRLQTWLPRIIRKEFLPDKIDPNQFYGVPKLRGGHNFIIGQLRNPEQSATIRFQANGLRMIITARSEAFFPNGVDKASDADIIKAITSLVNYPEDKVGSISLEKHCEQLVETDEKMPLCYGRLRNGGYNEKRPPSRTKEGEMQNVQTWWNSMIFWVTKGELFISTTMVNWETMPASLDPYVFKLGAAK